MSGRSDRDDLHAPCIAATFAAGSARALESTDAPRNAQHLPCQVTVQVVAGPKNFVFKDVNGTSNTIAFPTGTYTFRAAPSTIESSSTAEFITVWWQVLANANK